ncbi:gamma-tubulin complex component 6 [Diorhabda carinulata]|uniref:gamma-tubulin complex component 6 n=1 Tax=Diorhabda carinulata TaxID=1163345 RepID=UPI0025A289CC|nr:gamma-tubulin complex component 6 [Diorhabda carinulata]
MYSEEENDSVFNLITNLCEKFHNDPRDIKLARTRCYEILLEKRVSECKKDFQDLKGMADPYCNFLSWEFQLIHEYNMKNHAHELKTTVENVRQCYKDVPDDFNRILQFLMALRNVPTKNENILDLSSLPPIKDFENFNKMFQLPYSLKKAFNTKESSQTCDTIQYTDASNDNIVIKNSTFNELFKDEGYESPSKTPEDIWELASKLKYSTRRTWESFGYPEPDKEPPFMSELGALSSLWVENLESLYMFRLFKDGAVFNTRTIPRKEFIKDLKCLLVGLASESFGFDELGQFYLVPGISVEAITPEALTHYCKDLIFTGTCCKALNKLSTLNIETGKYKYQGYVYTEFCESVNRYLKFYQTAVCSIPDSVKFLQFHEKTYQLRLQVNTLASVCKIGPYTVSEETENGVALLNYLYHKVLSLNNEKVIYVLYSILYPCCQVYFSRFLKQWILEGTLNDPYGEYFIIANPKYIVSRGRTYWTRSYGFKEDIIPDFLVDLRSDILLCGKSMNLLKNCAHSSKLRLYLMGKKPPIISCCVTLDQLSALRQNTINYYLDFYEEYGSRFNIDEVLLKNNQEHPILLGLIAKKRAVTLKRLEFEREKVILVENEKKMEEMAYLREQYDSAMEQKQIRIAREIQEEIVQMEDNLRTELKRQNLVKEEAKKLIDFYTKLCESAEEKKYKIETQIKSIKNITIDKFEDPIVKDVSSTPITIDKFEDPVVKDASLTQENLTNSSTDSFYSIPEEEGTKTGLETIKENTRDNEEEKIKGAQTIEIEDCLDIVNANTKTGDDNANIDTISPSIQQAIENFEMARKNKLKVMTQELGLECTEEIKLQLPTTIDDTHLTQAQKNKLRVLTSEFGMEVEPNIFRTRMSTAAAINKNKVLSSEIGTEVTPEIIKTPIVTAATLNRNKVMGLSDCFDYHLDNENFLNKNVSNEENDRVSRSNSKINTVKKSKSLSLNLNQFSKKSINYDTDRQIPMSVDSTPLSDVPYSPLITPSTGVFRSCDTPQTDLHTSETQQTEEGFNFIQKHHEAQSVVPIYLNKSTDRMQKNVFSKRVDRKQVSGVFTNSLRLFLHECVQIPLVTQTKLINGELLRYFIEDLEYLKHLSSLRDYFFLHDGEFGRHINDNLFKRLYEADSPAQLINCRVLQDLIFGALDMSNKNQKFSSNLSFKINSMPNCFDLGNPDILDCISLTYKVSWPLNILLPTDTIAKYDEVFKFLMKLNRVSWVLKQIFMELKVLARETGKKEIYLMASPQYRKLHQCRHIMTQFVQTLQNYVVGEVLQSSWSVFEKNLSSVTSLDELYQTHTTYIKNILFMCLLTQKMTALKNIIHKTFMVILKFFDYLRSRNWICQDGDYVHPNFNKLKSIFNNFQEFVLYMFKVIRKVAKSGYQPHLLQLLEMLDINYYFTESLKVNTG